MVLITPTHMVLMTNPKLGSHYPPSVWRLIQSVYDRIFSASISTYGKSYPGSCGMIFRPRFFLKPSWFFIALCTKMTPYSWSRRLMCGSTNLSLSKQNLPLYMCTKLFIFVATFLVCVIKLIYSVKVCNVVYSRIIQPHS